MYKLQDLTLKKYDERFADRIMHDLRVPALAQFRGLELLESKTLTDSEQKEMIAQIKESCSYTLDLIEMVQNLYNIEKEIERPYGENFDIIKLISECRNALMNKFKQKNIALLVLQSQDKAVIHADRQEIKTVLVNLLNFAVNYTKNNARTIIRTRVNNGNFYFSITACGLPVKKGYLNKIFELNTKQKFATVGEEICMFLNKKYIEMNNGSIYASTNGKNSVTITFKLPVLRAFEHIPSGIKSKKFMNICKNKQILD